MTDQEFLALPKDKQDQTLRLITEQDVHEAVRLAELRRATPALQINEVRIIEPTPAETAAVSRSAGRGDLPEKMPDALAALKAHLLNWYSGFDWQSMEMCLCAVLTHYAAKETQAIWPFIVGAPRTGKTEAVIRAFEGLPQAYSAGDITPKAMMSSNEKKGLLQSLNEQGKKIILFKDFTSMLGKRIEDAAEVMSAFREIADGNYARWTGNGQVPPWEGKLTILAAVTPVIEKHRALLDALGPRFLFIRWSTPPARDVSRRAITQIDHEGMIRHRSQELVKAVLNGGKGIQLATLPGEHLERIIDYCEAFVKMRQPVDWDYHHNYIEGPQEPEGAGAIAKHLDLIARSRAALHGREVTNEDDLALARRIALDSLPQGRLRIVRRLLEGDSTIDRLAEVTKMEYKTVFNIVKELRAIGLLPMSKADNLVLDLGTVPKTLFQDL